MLRGLTGLVAIIIIFGTILGLAVGSIELLNPALSAAKASRMNEETAALRARNAHEQRLYEIEIEKQQALAQIEVKQKEQRAELLNEGLALAAIVLPIGLFAVLFAGAIYITCQAAAILSRHSREKPQHDEPKRPAPLPAERATGPATLSIRSIADSDWLTGRCPRESQLQRPPN